MARKKRIIGTDGNDSLLNDTELGGTRKNDLILGLDGDDDLLGHKGNDVLEGGNGLDTLDGGKGNDKLFGGEGNDVLRGGSGRDFLKGGTGKDTFVFDVEPGRRNVDKIKDFNVTDDTIELDAAIFTAFDIGSVDATEFHIGKQAETADQHLIYNSKSGFLLYDADGAGRDAAVKVAQLQKGLALTFDDFLIA